MNTEHHGCREIIREPIVEGIFYPEDTQNLKDTVNRYLDSSGSPDGCRSIIVPHAAYEHCGQVIGSAFQHCRNFPAERIVLMGPIHRSGAKSIYLTESSSFSTPLGEVAVDTDIVDRLEEWGTLMSQDDIPHLEEHSLEVMLPFIQVLFPKARIIPILFGKTTVQSVQSIAKALEYLLSENIATTLFVASNNISPMQDSAYIEEEERRFTSFLKEKPWQDLVQAYYQNQISACGSAAIGVCKAILPPEFHWREVESIEVKDTQSESKSILYTSYAACHKANKTLM